MTSASIADAKPQTVWRKDIQLLRAIAVLLVVIYHADLGVFAGGFLGVDVFFVVSGFLMTRILVTELWQNGRIGLIPFFMRRARRLMPAAASTAIVTGALCLVIYTQDRFAELGKFMFGAVFFISNILFFRSEKDYFASEQNANPFLHFWSLSVEEQFYFIFPIFLILARKYVFAAIVTAAIASYAACAYMVSLDASAAFYLLPFRAWELLIGSVCFLLSQSPKFRFEGAARDALAIGGLGAIAGFGIIPIQETHPGFGALGATLATATVLLASPTWKMEHPTTRWTSRVGDWSYSIYLVHWPLFAFASELYIGLIPTEVAVLLCLFSVLLGYLQYRFVEQKFRTKGAFSLKTAMSAAALVGVPALGAIALAFVAPRVAQPVGDQEFKFVFGLNEECRRRQTFALVDECVTDPSPNVLVWGDSYAAHLLPGLAATPGARIAAATKVLCGPAPRVEYRTPRGSHNQQFAKGCARFNNSVMDELERGTGLEVVALSAAFRFYLKPNAVIEGFPQTSDRMADVTGIFTQTIENIRATGARVVLIAAPPHSEMNVGRCLKRQFANKPLLVPSCDIPKDAYKAYRADVIALVNRVSQSADIDVIWPGDFLCGEEVCRTSLDGQPLYFDGGHFSQSGSKVYAERAGLLDDILAKAR